MRLQKEELEIGPKIPLEFDQLSIWDKASQLYCDQILSSTRERRDFFHCGQSGFIPAQLGFVMRPQTETPLDTSGPFTI
jgi:hypothetical protein